MLGWLKSLLLGSTITPEQMAKIRPLVDSLINSSRVMVFSKSYCPYCSRAKSTLRSEFGDDIKVLELDQDDDGSAIQAYLAQRANQSSVTVPQIYINQNLIGGNDDLQALIRQRGEWDKIKSSGGSITNSVGKL